MTKSKTLKYEKPQNIKVPRALAAEIVALMEQGSALIQAANYFGSHRGGDKFAALGAELDMILNPKKYQNQISAYARQSVLTRQ